MAARQCWESRRRRLCLIAAGSLRTASRLWGSQDTDPSRNRFRFVTPSANDAELVHAEVERARFHPQSYGCRVRAFDSPAALLTDLDDVGPLDVAQRGRARLAGSCGGRDDRLAG